MESETSPRSGDEVKRVHEIHDYIRGHDDGGYSAGQKNNTGKERNRPKRQDETRKTKVNRHVRSIFQNIG